MISKEDIIARTKEALLSYKTTKGTLTAHRLDPDHDGLDRFILGLDYPDRLGMTIECPRDFERLLIAYFDAHPQINGIHVTITSEAADFQPLDRAAIDQQDEYREDELKLHEMRRLNKIMYTGRPGEADYDPHSTTPCISDKDLKAFEDALARKRRGK